ncbi:hypothetical protein [Methylobacterium soli]|uniref:Uncharacterized protein n=1 Tax=Methylobacterium soli TaxID=553447 RepID=A0A6L3ST07_9HYPH|nr:hypothetical protein [Methylobacterium soli]KAB1076719.1 hypothetical protein F6X53_21760 [Methylobacterium soli]
MWAGIQCIAVPFGTAPIREILAGQPGRSAGSPSRIGVVRVPRMLVSVRFRAAAGAASEMPRNAVQPWNQIDRRKGLRRRAGQAVPDGPFPEAAPAMHPLAHVLVWSGVLGFIGMVGYASKGGAVWMIIALMLAGIAMLIRWR